MPPTEPTRPHDPGALYGLLDRNLQLPPEYRDGLTNHLPMALHALHSLGANAARLEAFYAGYATRFEGLPAPVAAEAPPGAWRAWRSVREQPDAFSLLQAAFTAAIAADGRDAVLRVALPGLLEGVAAAAFHGPIRTAHAVQAGHDGELAAALAYWAWRWQPLAEVAQVAPLPFHAWARRLVIDALAWTSDAPLIALRMGEATRSAPYAQLAGALAGGADLLPQLAAFALERYMRTRNFTVLHMVTGLRAVRVLSPWIADLAPAAPVLVRAFVAAYLAAKVREERASAEGPHDWARVVEAAKASDDEHVIKIVHACRDEAAFYGGGSAQRYLQAAALAVA
jgi:hypothetical protein